ncbi:MAG: sigma-70 family RNA polymerase sigma factor [Sedimenticola sp.]
MSQPSDESLMLKYREGDTSAFDRLYTRHRGPLFRYIDRLTNNHAEAEELFQDVWMRLIRARAQWQPERGFKPWLYRIAHNRLVDHWRTLRGEQLPLEDDHVVTLEARWPDAWLIIKDCIERLFHLLGGLSEPQRSAFLLKEEANLSLAEIAEVTGVGRETVKSRLRYALRSLRTGLEGCDE